MARQGVCVPVPPAELESTLLQGVRLPDTPTEWGAVRSALEAVGPAFRPDSSPAALLTDLMTLADECAAWWDSRNKPAAGKLF